MRDIVFLDEPYWLQAERRRRESRRDRLREFVGLALLGLIVMAAALGGAVWGKAAASIEIRCGEERHG